MGIAPDHKRRWKFSRGAWIERWRVGVYLRVYHGFGLPQFEFEFRLGRPKRIAQPTWIDLEGNWDDSALGTRATHTAGSCPLPKSWKDL